jgi:hypothetical protein
MKTLLSVLAITLIALTSASYAYDAPQHCNTYCTEIAGSQSCDTVCTQ